MGSQGEQPRHTNYAQSGEVDALRGGYAEDWTVFWIAAHCLDAAAQFIELGAPVPE